MSRQSGYKQHRPLMSNVDIDLDSPERYQTPSPPPQLSNIPKYEHEVDKSDNTEDQDDAPPQTPYYDYACNIVLKVIGVRCQDHQRKPQNQGSAVGKGHF